MQRMEQTMTKYIVWLIIGLWLSVIPIMGQSATPESPLLFTAKGQIYAWVDDETVQLTPSDGYSYSPDYAPDRSAFVYRTWSQIMLNYRDTHQMAEWRGELPTDIAIYDFATGESRLITFQPDYANPVNLVGGVRHSAPKWSHDGTMIAWLESMPNTTGIHPETMFFQLVVYNLVTEQVTVIATDFYPEPYFDMPIPIEFGENGIYTHHWVPDGDKHFQKVFFLFSPTGEKLFEIIGAKDKSAFTSFVAQEGEREVLALYYSDGTLQLIDKTGTIEDVTASALQKYNSQTPDGMATVMMVVNDEKIAYYVTNPQTQLQELLAERRYIQDDVHSVMVSPNGNQIALIDKPNGVITIWQDMEITTIERPMDDGGDKNHISEFAWGNQRVMIVRS